MSDNVAVISVGPVTVFEVGCHRRLALFLTDFSKQKRQRNAETE
jgi:hypothetical protein